MSVFTNAASDSPEQARTYVAALLGLVGDTSPVEILKTTEPFIRHAVSGLSRAQIVRPEAPGKWSMRHVFQHLADSELVWGFRVRMVLAHDRPRLVGYDQDLFAERLGYDQADPDEALMAFGVLRRAHVTLLDRLAPDDLKRVGLHAERGEESVAHMIRLYAGHDMMHRRQLERIRLAVVA